MRRRNSRSKLTDDIVREYRLRQAFKRKQNKNKNGKEKVKWK